MNDLTPEHTSRRIDGDLHPEVSAAYKYVDSVVSTADAQSPMGGYAWHGWALREAFLAGCTYARALLDKPVAEGPSDEELMDLWLDSMTNLSPAAQAVLRAAGDSEPGIYATIVAALRAAADQVVPKTPTLSYPEDYELGVWVANDDAHTELLAIADELEGAQ